MLFSEPSPLETSFPLDSAGFKFIVPEKKRFRAHLNVYSKPAVIDIIREGLSSSDWAALIDGCFGAIVRAGDRLYFYSQLVHQMLLHEVETKKKNEMWFKVGQHLLRFSLAEFCCVTGLVYEDNGSDKSTSPQVDMEEFLGVSECSLDGLIAIFKKEPKVSPKKLSLAYLLLIEGVLLPQRKNYYVRQQYVDLVSDLVRLSVYPFGRLVYLETLSFLKKGMRSEQANRGERFGYNVFGYPLAFQVVPFYLLLSSNFYCGCLLFLYYCYFILIFVLIVVLISGLDFRSNS